MKLGEELEVEGISTVEDDDIRVIYTLFGKNAQVIEYGSGFSVVTAVPLTDVQREEIIDVTRNIRAVVEHARPLQ